MTRVIADENLKARLKDFSEHLEICDESGRVLGYFQPTASSTTAEIHDWAEGGVHRGGVGAWPGKTP